MSANQPHCPRCSNAMVAYLLFHKMINTKQREYTARRRKISARRRRIAGIRARKRRCTRGARLFSETHLDGIHGKQAATDPGKTVRPLHHENFMEDSYTRRLVVCTAFTSQISRSAEERPEAGLFERGGYAHDGTNLNSGGNRRRSRKAQLHDVHAVDATVVKQSRYIDISSRRS